MRSTPAKREYEEPAAVSVAERRREQIADAAVALFAQRGYVNTTIEDISNKVGVGKGLIYRYYKDKQDVLFHSLCAVLEKYKKENVPALLETLGPLAALKKILSINCALAQEHAQEVILAYRTTKDLDADQQRRIKAIEQDIVGEIEHCLNACIGEGSMNPLNVRIMAYQYVMFGHTWALKQWALSPQFTVAEFVAEGEKLLIEPFLTAAGRRRFKSSSADTVEAAAKRTRIRVKA